MKEPEAKLVITHHARNKQSSSERWYLRDDERKPSISRGIQPYLRFNIEIILAEHPDQRRGRHDDRTQYRNIHLSCPVHDKLREEMGEGEKVCDDCQIIHGFVL